MTALDHFKGILGISGGFWMIYGLYCIFSIRRFIVQRYEQETDLLNGVYFTEHLAFTRYLYSFYSSGLYAMHLLICAWPLVWRFYGKLKIFRDIEDPVMVTRHFTAHEIRRVKRTFIVMLIVALHFASYLIFRAVWPEAFA